VCVRPKDVFLRRVRAMDSDTAEEACWNVVQLCHNPRGHDS
jgi:hypothetical protein